VRCYEHDQIGTQFRSHLIEQFFLGLLLERYTEAGDVVFHYWMDYFWEPLRQRLPALIKEQTHLHLRQGLEASYPHRLKSAWFLTRRQETLQQLGYFRFCDVGCSG
jgi:hypothetical protein